MSFIIKEEVKEVCICGKKLSPGIVMSTTNYVAWTCEQDGLFTRSKRSHDRIPDAFKELLEILGGDHTYQSWRNAPNVVVRKF